jgi:hypothetical protein
VTLKQKQVQSEHRTYELRREKHGAARSNAMNVEVDKKIISIVPRVHDGSKTPEYIWPRASPEPGRAHAFGDEAWHGTEMKRAVAFKRVVPCRRPGTARAEAWIYKICLFFINLVILIKKLFNITKFKLKT